MTGERRVKLFTDEHVHSGLAAALRQRGHDAMSCREAERSNQRISDQEQLTCAAQEGRAILTNNIGDFILLDHAWKITGRHHTGIILYPRITTFGELLRRVERHIATTDPEVQDNTLLWLA